VWLRSLCFGFGDESSLFVDLTTSRRPNYRRPGRRRHVAAHRRIISLYGGLTGIFSALGVADRVVACIQGDETSRVSHRGHPLQPNVEMILPETDLVVQGGVAKGMPALTRLEAAQVPVAMFAPQDLPACSVRSPGWGSHRAGRCAAP